MARSLPLPAVAWIVTIMLPHAVQPTLEEGDHSPNDETIPVNASRQETNSVVDITNVWPNISEPTRSKTHGNVTGTLGGRFAWPVGLRQGLSAYSIESVSIVPEVPARVSKYSDGGLRVSLSKCAHAVLGADVTVTVEKKASGETANLRLYDDGVGAS
ncbi:uncharacterized protein LOC144153970 [Haemaphysalis longicornis]